MRAAALAVIAPGLLWALTGPTQAATAPARTVAAPGPGTLPARCAPGTPRLRWPTAGALVTRFGARVKGLPANGIDLAAFAGMTVRAAAPGTVRFAGREPERFGELILIDHGGGWITAYAYLGKVLVREGQKVTPQTVIARIGASGEARKPTLHFELRQTTTARDPLPCLPLRL